METIGNTYIVKMKQKPPLPRRHYRGIGGIDYITARV